MHRVQASYPWDSLLETGAEEELVASSRAEPRPGVTVPLPDDLHPAVRESLAASGIEALWSHQADALESARLGDTIVTTGTASGKSLAFNLPVLDTLASDPSARALYLYPTKALAQDQARKLSQLGGRFLRHAIYDGDTPREERRAIRQRSNIILSNPDMLHVGVLPNHASWGDVLANLAWVVVDEAHVYRGVFGSHVANVLRRLRRLARAYGAEPRFVLTSATIANPRQLAEGLTGLEVLLVDRDGAPHAERQVVMWNPPLVDEQLGKRASALSEAAMLLAGLVEREVRTICFLKSRRGVELIQRFARLRLEDAGRPDLAERIAPYRAGYTPAQRREIERRLGEGDLLAVVATDALELGIDVGDLDAAVCVTFPGTVASLRQMWGRAGRRDSGLAMYVAGEDALDQFFCRHPDEFLERPVERAILDHESEEIHLAHLAAAAYELPLTPEDEDVFGPRWEEHARRLVKQGRLRERGGRYLPRGPGYPAGEIALRSASPDSVAIVESTGGELIGTVESARAHSAVHPGAVYLHMGASYEVEELDLRGRRALVRPFQGDWYTQPKRESETWIEQVRESRECCGVELSFGIVSV
ncbi:MAG: DEAD/DEAH box helicase, partial [Thermoleophilaceae bacterium]